MNSDFLAKARALAAAGRELHARGWVPATSGNFSMRLASDSVLVTASGRHKGRLNEQDFLAVDLQGQPVDGGKPSAETLLHTQLYARFPKVNAALHCHTPASTVLSMHSPEAELVFEGYELQKAFAGVDTHESVLTIPVFDNTQDIAALAKSVDAYFDRQPDCPAYVIRGHGVYCWADSLDACQRELEALDFLFHCELELRRLRG
ncbi:methylthioribulose 1-phosphate dehydratase [Litorivivens sp.]|uniref:methylthioribulose 1-phosphate dehydratase n=1 Tax=Litorivivens sp. TaxID=2020868 RepID=UPI003566D19A